jgi:hypothetical protein
VLKTESAPVLNKAEQESKARYDAERNKQIIEHNKKIEEQLKNPEAIAKEVEKKTERENKMAEKKYQSLLEKEKSGERLTKAEATARRDARINEANKIATAQRLEKLGPVDQSEKGKPSNHFMEKSSKMSIDDIDKSLSGRLISNNLKESVAKGTCDLKVAQELHASVEHSMSEFGSKFNEKVAGIEIGRVESIYGKSHGDAMAVYDVANQKIIVSSSWLNDKEENYKESLERSVNEGYHPKGCNTVKSVVDHEIGHAFTLELGQKDPILAGKMALPGKLTEREWKPGLEKEKSFAPISGYATTNRDEQMAETFAAGQNGGIKDPEYMVHYNAILDHIGRSK